MGEGGKALDGRVKKIRKLHLGEIFLRRRRYGRIREGKIEFSYLLDERLKIVKKSQIVSCVRKDVMRMKGEGLTGKAILNQLLENNVSLSEQTVSLIRSLPKEKEKREKIDLPQNRLYFNLDDGVVSNRLKNRQVEKTRARTVSAYTHRERDQTKNRGRLKGKRYFVEFYPLGARIGSLDYSERLLEFLRKNYKIDKKTRIYGATDGAPSLKRIVRAIPNRILVASKFHVRRNIDDPGYLRNNREGMKAWEDPNCLGYSAESDISCLKRKLGFGNRVYNLENFKNLLRLDNFTVT